jgi:hypothetical protein
MAHLNTSPFPNFANNFPILWTISRISSWVHPSSWWSCKHSSAKSSLMAICFQIVFYCLHVHWHIFCWFVYRHYPQINSVISLQMQCSTEESPLEGTEDCWVPPPLLQSFVTCNWGSHSFCPDASSFPYCQVKLLHLWPNKASECSICHHVRRQLMPPLKVPGVSHFLITYLLHDLYTII